MKYSIIDIGSNSMQLTVYEVGTNVFHILFKDKIMAGLAGYVDNGFISEKGILRASEALLEFKNTLSLLGITDRIYVFATASLRNVLNTDDAVGKITSATGFPIEVITGAEEALYGYIGIMRDLGIYDGTFIDIGGASAEISILNNQSILFSKSYHVGSLKVYKDCVKNILPGKGSVKRIHEMLKEEIPREELEAYVPRKQLACTGGTSRSIMKIARHLGLIRNDSNIIGRKNFDEIGKLLLGDSGRAADIILKVDPSRIHTIVPGYMILQYIVHELDAEEIIVSSYGVREGYLCHKILHRQVNTDIPKTEN